MSSKAGISDKKLNGLKHSLDFSKHFTYSMYFRETFWVCLVLMVRIYICRAAKRRAVSYLSSDPNLSSTTSLQLWKTTEGGNGQRSPSFFLSNVSHFVLFLSDDIHLNIEVLKSNCVSPEQLHRILWYKCDAKKALHLV